MKKRILKLLFGELQEIDNSGNRLIDLNESKVVLKTTLATRETNNRMFSGSYEKAKIYYDNFNDILYSSYLNSKKR